jgi:hypothetical protein
VRVGYERKDSSLTVFTKAVLMTTFESDSNARSEDTDRGLIVASNIWGFQYVEDRMECKEVDLKMWLSINYQHFRTLHFNTYKDSGMPAFAMEGVQTRYEDVIPKIVKARTFTDGGLKDRSDRYESDWYGDRFDDPVRHRDHDARSSVSRRNRHRRRQEPSFGSFLFGNRH